MVRGELAEQVVRFCRFARTNGFTAGVTESLASVEAAEAIVPADRDTLRWALRTALCSSKEEWDSFDRLFKAFMGGRQPDQRFAPAKTVSEPRGFWVLTGETGNTGRRSDNDAAVIAGASVHQRLKRIDFSQTQHSDQPALDRLAQRLLRQMSWRLSRKLKLAEPREFIDLRRTIRSNISRGGDPIQLRYKGKKPQEPRLVILLDVSGSMSLYSLFLLRFAHALSRSFKRTDTFIFSTGLLNISSVLKSNWLDAKKALAKCPADWAGGTRVGGCLHEFNLLYGKLLSRDTLFIILSDGWDTGRPELLAAELRSIQQRVRKVIWLNPLLGLPDYQPVTRGMAAALPYVDVFAPAHSLESLLELEKHLTKRPG